MKTPRKHKHAELIKQWLEDDSLEVEWREFVNTSWNYVRSPSWDEDTEYRIKPKMIRCGDLEFPEPMRVAPKRGDMYWVASICNRFLAYEFNWDDCTADGVNLARGVCHKTNEAAEAHAKALIALTESKE